MPNDTLLMRVRAALSTVTDPDSGRSIVAAGLVRDLTASPAGVVKFTLASKAPGLLERAERAAAGADGAERVVALGPEGQAQGHVGGGHDNPLGMKKPKAAPAETLKGVKNVIAVASGKGGVGKSTVAANLAVALAARGLRVGLMDADIYGPSLPTLFGVSGRPELIDGKLVPAEKFGVKAMSIGLLVDADQALAWRGPMVMGAIRQLMNDVDWGPLDVLIIDTPPGTGDAHLSLAQSGKLTGAIIVSTPQEMALADVRRGVSLFRKVDAQILGVIENMAWLETGGERHYVFGNGGAERTAQEIGAPFLGAAPLWPDLREASDAGTPIAAGDSHHPAARFFSELAEKVADSLSS